jgi:hypothetical protein
LRYALANMEKPRMEAAWVGDYVNQVVHPAAEVEKVPVGQRVWLPTEGTGEVVWGIAESIGGDGLRSRKAKWAAKSCCKRRDRVIFMFEVEFFFNGVQRWNLGFANPNHRGVVAGFVVGGGVGSREERLLAVKQLSLTPRGGMLIMAEHPSLNHVQFLRCTA